MNNNLILRTLTSPYGDITRGTVLSQSDVDNNFIFLKGSLIYTATSENGVVTLTKNNGDTLSWLDAAGLSADTFWSSGSSGNYSIKRINDSAIDATGDYSYAEGQDTTASGTYSHAEGSGTIASGTSSHSEGTDTIAYGLNSHAEGDKTRALGSASHAEGVQTTASGPSSHTEGQTTIASGAHSHAGGLSTIASGIASFVHGTGSTAGGIGTVVLGNGITGTTDNTTYVNAFNIKTIGGGTPLINLGLDSSGNVVTGSTSTYTFTGGTVTGPTIFTGGLSANTFSATTYYNLPTDITVTGGTYSNSTGIATLTNNTGGTFNVSGFFKPADDIYVSGASFNNGTYDLIIGRNDATDFTVNLGLLSTDIKITGGTYNNNTGIVTFTNSTGGTFQVSGFITGLTDTTISSYSYDNANTFTIQDTTGGTFTASIETVTGFTVNGALSATTFSGGNTSLSGSSDDAMLSVTNIGAGNVVEFGDSQYPDLTSFAINQFGIAGIGVPLATWSGTSQPAYSGNSIIGTNRLFVDGNIISSGDKLGIGYYDTTNTFGLTTLISGSAFGALIESYANGHLVMGLRDNNASDGFHIVSTDAAYTAGTSANYTRKVASFLGDGSVTIEGTLSATTYLGLPTDITVTGGTYTAGTATFTNNTGGTFNVTGFLTGSTGGGTPALNPGEVFVGSTLSAATSVPMTGDVFIDLSGVTTIQPDSVTYDKMQDVTSNAVLGSIATSGGTVEEIPVVDLYLTPGVATTLLVNAANWNGSGVYTGATITNTYQGQSYVDSSYWFTAVNDNDWIRLSRI